MDKVEVSDEDKLVSYLKSIDQKAPNSIDIVVKNAVDKANVALTYALIQRLSRAVKVSNYLDKLEDYLFAMEDTNFGIVPYVELKKRYDSLNYNLSNILEFARKFTFQNKDVLTDASKNKEVDALYEKLASAPPQVIEKLKELLKG